MSAAFGGIKVVHCPAKRTKAVAKLYLIQFG